MSPVDRTDLAGYAARADESRGRRHPEVFDDERTAFEHDRDRIIHCAAFRRLEYKTQVFVNHEGDYYRTRLTHSLEVAQLSRSIARRLRLNEDLAETIALSHDLGHPPFGHSGERVLHGLMAGHGGFEHNHQSLRIVEELEERYPDFPGLNLTWEAREGIAKHSSYKERPGKGYLKEYDPGMVPSLESQIIGLADEIAYNNHDIDDGLKSGLIAEEELSVVPMWKEAYKTVARRWPLAGPRMWKYRAVSQIIRILVNDLVNTTRENLQELGIETFSDVLIANQIVVGHSKEVRAEEMTLKRWLFANLYTHPQVEKMRGEVGALPQGPLRRLHRLPAAPAPSGAGPSGRQGDPPGGLRLRRRHDRSVRHRRVPQALRDVLRGHGRLFGAKRPQILQKALGRDRPDLRRERKRLVSGVDDVDPGQSEIGERRPHRRRDPRSRRALDLEADEARPLPYQEVDLGPGMSAPEEAVPRSYVELGHHGFEEEPLPGGSQLRMTLQFAAGRCVQEVVEDAGVPEVDPRRFDLPLAEVGAEGLEGSHHEGCFQSFEVSADRVVRNAEGASELRGIPNLTVRVGQHRPESLQGRSRDRDAELWHVSLEKGANEVSSPLEARPMRPGGVRGWETASEPKPLEVLDPHLGQGETAQFVVGDAACQGLGALPQQIGRCASEHQKASGGARSVRQDPQGRKEVRPALYLVEDDETAKRSEGELRLR